MFTYIRSVFLKDTDETGVIYFTSLFQYAMEAFEAFLIHKEISLSQIFSKDYLMPIVHAKADYKGPVRVADELLIELTLARVGTTSFSLESKIMKSSQEVGRVNIVHAFLKKGEKKASKIPEEILSLLEQELLCKES